MNYTEPAMPNVEGLPKEVQERLRAAHQQDALYFDEVKKEIGEDAALCISEIANIIGACRNHPAIEMVLGPTVDCLLGHVGTHFKLEPKPTWLIIEKFLAIRRVSIGKQDPKSLN